LVKKKDDPSTYIKPAKNRKNTRVCFSVNTGSAKQKDILAYSDNVSLGGVFLETDSPLPIGTKVTLRFPLKSTWEPMQVKGKVTWNRKKRAEGSLGSKTPGMGIIFEKMKKKDLSTLKEFLDHLPTYGWFLDI